MKSSRTKRTYLFVVMVAFLTNVGCVSQRVLDSEHSEDLEATEDVSEPVSKEVLDNDKKNIINESEKDLKHGTASIQEGIELNEVLISPQNSSFSITLPEENLNRSILTEKKIKAAKQRRLIEERTVEPVLYIKKGQNGSPQVALTFDLCEGETDYRILNFLIENKIKATLFLTKRWIRENLEAVSLLKKHLDLFEIENHGERHLPAIDNLPIIYGLKTAGNLANIRQEIDKGAEAIEKAGFPKPIWYRTAAARYSPNAIKLIENMGYKIAGFSINGDIGAQLSQKKTFQQISKAQDGDVVIAHLNQPKRASGAGVVQAILALKARGYIFIKLSESF